MSASLGGAVVAEIVLMEKGRIEGSKLARKMGFDALFVR